MKTSPPTRGARRGTIDLDPVRGHEQAGRRPTLVLSADTWNAGPGRLVTMLPITSRDRPGIPSRIAVDPPESGLTMPSWVICEQVWTISVDRLGPWGPSLISGTLSSRGRSPRRSRRVEQTCSPSSRRKFPASRWRRPRSGASPTRPACTTFSATRARAPRRTSAPALAFPRSRRDPDHSASPGTTPRPQAPAPSESLAAEGRAQSARISIES
jgi:mRNA interferase MazF